MANTKSAKKAARQAERRTLVNKNCRSRMRTYVRKVEEAIASGDKAAEPSLCVKRNPRSCVRPLKASSIRIPRREKSPACPRASRLSRGCVDS